MTESHEKLNQITEVSEAQKVLLCFLLAQETLVQKSSRVDCV